MDWIESWEALVLWEIIEIVGTVRVRKGTSSMILRGIG